MDQIADNTEPITKEDVLNVLVEEILSFKLPGGMPLTERNLADRFGLSRTPIREVLMRLKGEELITFYPNQGAFVRRLTAEDVRELFQIRLILEPGAAELAAYNRDDVAVNDFMSWFPSADDVASTTAQELIEAGVKFHDAIVEWSGNRLLAAIYDRLHKQTRLIRAALRTKKDAEVDSLCEHWKVLRAVQEKDGKEASEAMAAHLRRSRSVVMGMLLGQ